MSVSVTRTIPKKNYESKVVRQQRTYDYLYDPVYTVSSEVDHARTNLKACATKDRVRRVPEFGSMFSHLPHYPRYTVQLDPVDPVPTSVDRCWRGHSEQRKQALQQLSGFVPKAQSCDVSGAERWKYFKRPLIPFPQPALPDGIFALPKEDFLYSGANNAEQQLTRTVGVQTDYRESETQTDPYSPDYVLQSGSSPSELLQLASLSYGRGLPAGLAEVEMITRARAKRLWEASLPPLNDLEHLDKRRRMMEEMEAKEWAFREEEIQKLQEARLAVLQDLLRQRAETQKDVTNERLNTIYSKLLKEKDMKLQKIQNDYMRSLRKLDMKRKNVEGKLVRSGKDPQAHGSTLMKRSTRRIDDRAIPDLDTYKGLLKIEAGLSTSVLQSSKPSVTNDAIRTPVDNSIAQLQNYKAMVKKKNEPVKPFRFLIKKEKPVPRPVTPKVEEPLEEDEETELAVITLQGLLRGRSIQCETFKRKENHLDLIRELRTVHALNKEEQELKKADKEFVDTLKSQRDKQQIEISQKEAWQARVVGAELEHLFDTFSKELVRLQEERRIHAITLLAERDRRLREAEESGRRQVEERRRKEEDEIFRQVVQVHQETVDLYLEDIIMETMNTADQQARKEIHMWAKEVNDIAYEMEDSRNSVQSEEIVSELVYKFLIPEIQLLDVRHRVCQKQRRHLAAARSVIEDAAKDPGTCPSERPSSGKEEEEEEEEEEEVISQVEEEPGEGR